MLTFLKKLFKRKRGEIQPQPSLPQEAVQSTSLEHLQQAAQEIARKRQEEAAILSEAPKKNTNPLSFGYVANPFRDIHEHTDKGNTPEQQ